MVYFTILHWITLGFFLVLFLLLVFLSKKETNKKIFLSMVFASFLVTSMGAVFSMFVLDKYTKKAKLLKISHKRILRNESISITGKVKNVGKFKIGQCKLEVKIVSDALNTGKLKGSNIYKPRSGLGNLFTNEDKDQKVTTILKEFAIAKDLKPNEIRTFTINMKYPPYFQSPYFGYKLYCH